MDQSLATRTNVVASPEGQIHVESFAFGLGLLALICTRIWTSCICLVREVALWRLDRVDSGCQYHWCSTT